MRKVTCVLAIMGMCAFAASADTVTYDWEDGDTVLGLFGVGAPPIIASNVTAPEPVHTGDRSLKLVDNEPTGTPQAYVAWISGLADGDVVDASVWRYDDTPDASPSGRIWGHWNDNPSDLNGYNGSADGNAAYGLGHGWDQTGHSWIVAGGHTGLVIELRTYSAMGDTVWFDDLEITFPSTATLTIMPEPGSLVLIALGGLALVRRRQ